MRSLEDKTPEDVYRGNFKLITAADKKGIMQFKKTSHEMRACGLLTECRGIEILHQTIVRYLTYTPFNEWPVSLKFQIDSDLVKLEDQTSRRLDV